MNDFALTAPSCAWPLMFKFRAPILGSGFLALVEITGRLLARPEDDGRVWLEGVNPGALSLGAPNIATAHLELHGALTSVLVDIAEGASAFDAFKEEVVRFFHETDAETVREWDECLAAVQSGTVPGPAGLPVWSAELPLGVNVTCKSIEDVTPKDNPAPEPVLAAAA